MASVNAGSVKVSLIARMQQWASGIRQAETRLDSFARKVEANRARIQATGRALTVMGAAITGLTVAMGIKASNAADQLEAALLGLSKVAEFKLGKEAIPTATQAAKELADDGLITVSEAALGLKNLLLRGFGLPEAIKLMSRFKDTAAFGRQAALTMGQAVVSATEGLKNENSILVDNAGVTKNVSVMWKEYAQVLGKGANSLTQAEKIQAEMNGIMAESEPMLGNAAKLSETAAGSKAKLRNEIKKLWEQIGNALNPILKDLLDYMVPVISRVTQWITENKSLAASIVGVVAALGVLKFAGGLALIKIEWIIAILKSFKGGLLLLAPLFTTTYNGLVLTANGFGSVSQAMSAVTFGSIIKGFTVLSGWIATVTFGLTALTAIIWTGVDAWKAWNKVTDSTAETIQTAEKAAKRFSDTIDSLKNKGLISREQYDQLKTAVKEYDRLNNRLETLYKYQSMKRAGGEAARSAKSALSGMGITDLAGAISEAEKQYDNLLRGISLKIQEFKTDANFDEVGKTIVNKIADSMAQGVSKGLKAAIDYTKKNQDLIADEIAYSQFKSGEGRRSMVTRGMGALSDLANKPTAYLEALAKQLELYDRIAQKEQLVTIATLDSYDQRRVAADMYYQALSDEIKANIQNETVRTTLLNELERVRLEELGNITAEQMEALRKSYEGMTALEQSMFDGFVDSVSGGLTQMLQGTLSFAGGVKRIWQDMTNAILGMIAQIIAKWAALKIATSVFGLSVPGFADGGITTTGGGKLPLPLPAMATGGITLPDGGFPAILHPNELVAPLDKLPRLFPESYAKTSGKEQRPPVNNYDITIDFNDVHLHDNLDIRELSREMAREIKRNL